MIRSYARKIIDQLSQMRDRNHKPLPADSLYEVVTKYKPGDVISTAGYTIKINERTVTIQPDPMRLEKWRIRRLRGEGWVLR